MPRRLALFLASFVLIYALNFLLPRLMPGDPFSYTSEVSGEDATCALSPEQREVLYRWYGLDQPLPLQFRDTVLRNLRGDLGHSIHYKRPVKEILAERLPWTLGITGVALGLALLAGTALALIGLGRPHLERGIYALQSVLGEIPPFLIAILLLFGVAARSSWLPLAGAKTSFARYENVLECLADLARHGLLPALSLLLVLTPPFYFTARSGFLAVLRAPYLTHARAKGLGRWRIRIHYILRNAAAPLVARFFLSVGGAVSSGLLVENVFSYAGLGVALRESVRYRDYLMMQGVFLVTAILVLLSQFAAELINGWLARGGRAA